VRPRFLLPTALVASVLSLALGCQQAPRGDVLSRGPKLYSQHNEELIVRHFFGDERNGTFVDIGAWHWQEGSTTLYLEKHLGWKGIAVDAQGTVRQGYLDNRPGTKFFEYAVTSRSGQRIKFFLGGQLSSTSRKYTEFYDEPQGDQRAPEIEVETVTMNDLLAREGVRRFDFLSMDIEDGEPDALAGFDIERFKPRLVCIEAHKAVQDAISAYFADHGYERIDAYLAHDTLNWYYRPKPWWKKVW
jgi:FkbM family methyltransferase